jgi:predicted RNA-binding protein with TRAM domain
MHLDHFVVLEEGKREDMTPAAPVAEGAKAAVQLVEVGLHDPEAGVGKVEGFDVCVAGAAKMVGKKVNVQIERVLETTAYATLVGKATEVDEPITAEGEAEKPTRRAPAKKAEAEAEAEVEVEPAEVDEAPEDTEEASKPKKKTRRGSRGGRGRKKAATAAAGGNGASPAAVAKIHVPDPELGEEEQGSDPSGSDPSSSDGAEAPKPKKKTRRGTRGGRGRKKKTTTTAAVAAAEPAADETPASDWEYVPMSEWGDDVPEPE